MGRWSQCVAVFAVMASQSLAVAADPAPGPADARELRLDLGDGSTGMAVCYGPFREGQAPWGEQPTEEELLEDLRILAPDFGALRFYSARGPAETIVRLIDEHDLGLRVVVGAWIDPEVSGDGNAVHSADVEDPRERNRIEVAAAIELANAYPDVVAAVAVGNETQVFWSAHRSSLDTLIGYIRQVREATTVPVTTADDFRFWISADADRMIPEVDFAMVHIYAMWAGIHLDNATRFTKDRAYDLQLVHPGLRVVFGEMGWANRKHTEGDQGWLINGVPGQEEQERFFNEIREWAAEESHSVFFFSAFDEPWKGGDHPDEVEKHWGLYFEDRTPKAAMRGWRQQR